MALHFQVRLGEFLHEVGNGVKGRVAVLGELRRIELEVDTLLELVKVMLLLERTTDCIDCDTLDGVRAFVLIVGHAVLVGIERAAERIDRGAFRSIRALVLVIRHLVLVGIERAPKRIDRGAFRSIRALVLIIRHLVLVGIERATDRIDLHTLRGIRALVLIVINTVFVSIERATFDIDHNAFRSIRALVKTIEHLVLVGIDPATHGIDHDGLRRMRALVLVVLHAVSVVVADRLVAEGPGELRDTRDERVRHIAVVERLAVLALVFEHQVVAAVHFVVHVVARVEQVAHADVDAAGEVDVAEEVEERNLQVEARRQEHRVVNRADRVVVATDTHFTREFQEGLNPLVDHEVHGSAIDERVGTVTEHSDETEARIPEDGLTLLGVVHLGDAREAQDKRIGRIGVGVAAVAIQEPGVARAHTHVLPTGGEPHVEHHRGTEDFGAEVLGTVLAVQLDIAETAFDHAGPRGFAGVVLGVVVVDGQADTHIDIVGDTHGEVEVSGECTVNSSFFHVGIPYVELLPVAVRINELARTGVTPVVSSDGSARSGTETEEPESVRVLLMQAGFSA